MPGWPREKRKLAGRNAAGRQRFLALAGPQLMSLGQPIGSLVASLFCPEGRLPGEQLVQAVGQPDAAAVVDAQPLAPEPVPVVGAVAVPAAVAEAAPASPLRARVVHSEAAVAVVNLAAATAPA